MKVNAERLNTVFYTGSFFLWIAMKQLWGDNDHVAEIDDMIAEQEIINGEKAKSVLDLFRDQSVRWQLITVFLVCCCLQLIGTNAVSLLLFSDFLSSRFLMIHKLKGSFGNSSEL